MNGFLQADIFKPFPDWDSIVFLGAVTPKLLKFEITEGDRPRTLYLASIISRDEKTAWQSFQDLLAHTAELAQAGLQGIYGLDVLLADIRTGLQNFSVQDLSRLIIAHSKTLGAAHRTLIRYGQIFCALHKRAPADWGKIEVRTHVEIVDSEKTKFDGFLKKIRRVSGGDTRAVYLIRDMSAKPLWEIEDLAFRLPADTYFSSSKPA